VETRIEYGHQAQVLIDASKEADLIVVGSSGHGTFTGMLVGSVSIHCVTSAFCPVTVVRGDEAAAESNQMARPGPCFQATRPAGDRRRCPPGSWNG